jgi:hypothetical protein
MSDTIAQQTFRSGRNSVIQQTAIRLATGIGAAVRGVTIKADSDNAGTVFVGASAAVTAAAADATCGFPLAPGESVTVEVQDVGAVWLISETGTNTVYWLSC